MQKTNKKTDLGKSILNKSQRIFLISLLVFLFGFGLTAKASAATYYVDTNSVSGCAGTSQDTSQTVSSEMLTDGGAENWTNPTTLTNWSKNTAGSSSVNQESSTIHNGTYSARLYIDASTSNVFIYQGTTSLLTAGHRYRLSYYAKGTASFSIQPGYRGSSFHSINHPTLTTEWVLYEHIFTAAENARIEIGRNSGQGASQSFYLDDISLVELSTDCAWENLSDVTGLNPGDTVKLKRGSVWREPFSVPSSGTSDNYITFEPYGTGNKPAITKLTDFSPDQGYSWSNSGTPDSSIYKLTGNLTNPLLSPWGVLDGGHPEFNELDNGSFEDWTASVPDSWTATEDGSSAISQETSSAYTSDSGSSTLKMSIDGSASEASVAQNVTLSADSTFVFRAVHKETGSAQSAIRIKDVDSSKYFNFTTGDWDSSESAETNKNLSHQDSYYDSWIYFKTPSGSSASYEIKLFNGSNSAGQEIYFDQVVIIVKKQLNNNFFVATTTDSDWNDNGFPSLKNRERGLTLDSLEPGEWYWEDEVMYYRLASDESIDDVHIEIAQGNWNSSLNGITLTSKDYLIFKDIEIGYFQKYLISISSGSDNNLFERINAHNGDMAFLLSSGSNNTIRYSMGYDTFEHSFYNMTASDNNFYNCTQYKTQTDNGFNFYSGITGVEVKNTISASADTYQFSRSGVSDFDLANNLWFGNVDNNWSSNSSGTNSIANQDPEFNDPTSFDLYLQSTSPAIDAGTDVGLTTDYAGNPIYGSPDIGAYEYQPPYTMGSDEVDTAADVRVYGDGKFRNTETAGGTTANLTVDPASDDTSQYLDVNISTWDTSSTYEKEWTETSTTITGNTIHTVGDLEPNKYYNVTADDSVTGLTGASCDSVNSNFVCQADSNGEINFIWTGGYSTHTFNVSEGDNIDPTVTDNTTAKFHTDTTSVTLSLTTSENSTCKYSTENTTYDDMTSFSTTGETSHSTEVNNLTPGSYTYYAICRDGVGNDTSYTLSFEIAAEVDETDINGAKLKKDGDSQKLNDDKKIYYDQKKTRIKGEDSTIANGTVKIYKEGKRIATVDVEGSGKWSKKITFGHNKTYTLKIKFYDEYGTLRDTKEYEVKVDTENPIFTDPFPASKSIARDDKITFTATDEDSGMDFYKVKLLDENGHIVRGWRNQDEDWYKIPEAIENGTYILMVRAYDKAGNYAQQQAVLNVGNSIDNNQASQNQTDYQNIASVAQTDNSTPNVCNYTVQSGDTLWSIAKLVYGDATQYQKIIDLNKDKYSDIESRLSIDQELTFDCKNNTDNNADLNTDTSANQQVQGVQTQETQKTSPPAGGFKWYNPFTWF